MPVWEIFVVGCLILLNGFFAMSELAVVSSRRARLEQLADEGVRGARAAMRLMEEPTRFLSTVQVGITSVGVLAGAYSGATLAEPLAGGLSSVLGRYAYPVSVALVVATITYLSLVVGELVPKRIALNDPERLAARVARFMRALSVAGAPIVWLLRVSTETLIRLLNIPEKPESTLEAARRGTAAIRRFLRPVCFQGVPDALLPPALQDANPLAITRHVDGRPVGP